MEWRCSDLNAVARISSLESLDADNSFVTEVVTEVSFVRPCDQMNSSNLNRRVLVKTCLQIQGFLR